MEDKNINKTLNHTIILLLEACILSVVICYGLYFKMPSNEVSQDEINALIELNENAAEGSKDAVVRYANIKLANYHSKIDISSVLTSSEKRMVAEEIVKEFPDKLSEAEADELTLLIEETLFKSSLNTSVALSADMKDYIVSAIAEEVVSKDNNYNVLQLSRDDKLAIQKRIEESIKNDLKSGNLPVSTYTITENQYEKMRAETLSKINVNGKLKNYIDEHQVGLSDEQVAAIAVKVLEDNITSRNLVSIDLVTQEVEGVYSEGVAAVLERLDGKITKQEEENYKLKQDADDYMAKLEISCDNVETLRQTVTTEAGYRQIFLDNFYPVGSVYMSVENISPETFLGGTWEYIEDAGFLIGTDYSTAGKDEWDYSTAGMTGGRNAVTLSIDNIPSLSLTIGDTSVQTVGSPAISGTVKRTMSRDYFSFVSNAGTLADLGSNITGTLEELTTVPNEIGYGSVYMGLRTSVFDIEKETVVNMQATINERQLLFENTNQSALDTTNAYKAVYCWKRVS